MQRNSKPRILFLAAVNRYKNADEQARSNVSNIIRSQNNRIANLEDENEKLSQEASRTREVEEKLEALEKENCKLREDIAILHKNYDTIKQETISFAEAQDMKIRIAVLEGNLKTEIETKNQLLALLNGKQAASDESGHMNSNLPITEPPNGKTTEETIE